MKKNKTLYFVEVKTRYGTQYGYPEESVTKDKLSKIKKAIATYMHYNIRYISLKKRILIVSILYTRDIDQPEITLFEV